jgi:hypothetical protein
MRALISKRGRPVSARAAIFLLRLIYAQRCCERRNVSNGSFSTELGSRSDVRYAPDSDRTADIAGGPVRAMNGSEVASISPRCLRVP